MAKTPIKNVYVKVAGAVCSDVAHKGVGALALLAALTETEPERQLQAVTGHHRPCPSALCRQLSLMGIPMAIVDG